MKIVVYEHISGGGYASNQIPLGSLSEGFAMLRRIVSEFKVAGHEITVLLDDGISKLNPPLNADFLVPVSNSEEPKKFLANLAKINDAIYIIAPETGKTLQSFVEIAEQTAKISLNCESRAIQKVADKIILYKVLKKNGLATPNTIMINFSENLADIKCSIKKKLAYPVVFKPVDGAGCSGLSVVMREEQVDKAIAKLKIESADRYFIVQEFIEGEAASVSLLCANGKAISLTLNRQNIKIGAIDEVSSYEGGIVPFDHPLKEEAFRAAEKLAECIPGLRGYVGVDLVFSNGKAFVIDVNPRLTTSFVGLSQTTKLNIAEEIVNTIVTGRLPVALSNNGYSCFSKFETPIPTSCEFQDIAQIVEVISPPFPIGDSKKACSLICGYDASLERAKVNSEEAKKHVLKIINRGN